jgi:cyclase
MVAQHRLGFLSQGRSLRYAFLVIGAGLLLPALPVRAQEPAARAQGRGNSVQQIVPGIWFRRGGRTGSNNIIIEMKDYLIVVDTGYPDGARAVISEAKKLSPKPIRWVIDTHWHPDHAYGNHLFTQLGATTIAYVGAYDMMEQWEPQMWQAVARHERKDVAALNLPNPEPPMLLYTTSPYVISDGTRRVELYYFGYGHTRSDTFVYLPKEKILCTGDAVGGGFDPKNAYIAGAINEVRAAQKLDVEMVLPGHSAPGGKEMIATQLQFLVELYAALDAAIKREETLDQLVTMSPANRAIATTVRLSQPIMDLYVHQPADRRLNLTSGERFPTQVRDTYLEITQGKPYGDIVDPGRNLPPMNSPR